MASLEYCIGNPFRYPYASRAPRNRFEYIAEAVLADLLDRRGISHELEAVDEDVRNEIVENIAAVVAEIISKELPDPEPPEWRA